MHNLFILLDYLSVFVMIACVVIVATHESGKMQKLALMVCVMLLFSCTGFLLKAEATTADVMIAGQKIVYATVTHSMLLMLLFILEYCRFRIPKALEWVFHGINLFITVVVLTLDHHDLFYVSYWAEEVGGHMELIKEYGPVHTLTVGIFGLYMAAALVSAIVFSVKNIRERSRYVWRLLVAVSFPCLAYVIPKLTDSVNELQPIAFALFAVLLLQMVYKSKIYDVNDIATQYALKTLSNALIIFGEGYSYKGCNEAAAELFPFLRDTGMDKDLRASSEFLCRCADGKEKEYTAGNRIFSVSVRPVRSGESVIGRVVWLADVTMERNYTRLLKAQKRDLETRVKTLYGISNTDEMTGLGNRRCYEQNIAELRKKPSLTGVVVAEIDLNGLKEVNDTIGHNAGDEMIIGASDLMKDVFSEYGKIFRTGGDEFFVIVQDVSADVEKLKVELESAVRSWHGVLLDSLSLSYGFVKAEEHPDKTIDELMVMADQEMYRCKAAYYASVGKDRRHTVR